MVTEQTYSLKNSFIITTLFVGFLWLIKTVEVSLNYDLATLGVYPQQLQGLLGIIFSPLIHSSWNHLANNSLPLLILGTMLFYSYPKSSWSSIVIIWLFSGLAVWLFARPSYHIGASGLTHGLFFYLLLSGILRRDKKSIVTLMIAFFMYGSMIMSISPREAGISYESHFFGGLAGFICALLFYKKQAKMPEKKYSWEGEEETEVAPEDAYWLEDNKLETNKLPSETQPKNIDDTKP